MSYKIWMTHYLGTWHFLSTMQIYLKSMNSLSGAESTAMQNTGWGWRVWKEEKAGGHQGFAICHGQPCYSTPSPMEWHFRHPQDPKKDPPLSPWTATRMIIPNTGIRSPFRGRQHSEIWPLPHHQRLDTMQLKMRKAQALCSVCSHPPGFCLFSIFVSAVCVVVGLSHHSYHSHFLYFTNIHPLGTPICPAQSSGAQKNVLYCWWRSWTAFILLSWEVGGALR